MPVSNVPLTPEAELVRRLKRGEKGAFARLVEANEAAVYRLAWRILGHEQEAEDLVQEVFVQVFRSIEQFREDSKLSTWLYRITLNLAKNRHVYLRRRQRDAHSSFEGSLEEQGHERAVGWTQGEVHRPDQEMLGKETAEALRRALAELPVELRELLVLRDVEGLSYEEIAEITGLVLGTLKSRLNRARQELKRLLELYLGEKIQ